jgi:ADP-ribose pyrophosphatase
MRVLSSEVLYEGKLRAVRDVIETSDGKLVRHETIEHPGAVVVLPILADGKFVFVEQYRHSIREVLLELPAGTLEKGEEPSVCALRELTEEIGMTSDDLVSLGELLPAPGFCNERQYLFCGRSLRPERGIPDEDESIVTVQLSKDEALDAVRTGRLRDAKSIALLMRALLQGYL